MPCAWASYIYCTCNVGWIRRASESDERQSVSKIKAKMTKGRSSKRAVAAQTAFGAAWKMCSEARSSSFGYQLTISFVRVTPLKQKSVLFHHMLESVRNLNKISSTLLKYVGTFAVFLGTNQPSRLQRHLVTIRLLRGF